MKISKQLADACFKLFLPVLENMLSSGIPSESEAQASFAAACLPAVREAGNPEGDAVKLAGMFMRAVENGLGMALAVQQLEQIGIKGLRPVGIIPGVGIMMEGLPQNQNNNAEPSLN
jgi:hypothetical protein